jgi:shikimate kinase
MACWEPRNPTLELNRNAAHATVLVGYMGAGKTSVGRIVAHELAWDFVDLDQRIETQQGCSIATIFRDRGEQTFRQIEREVLQTILGEVAAGMRVVLALGGGAYVAEENAKSIRASSIPVVFLDAPVDELHRRCSPNADTRPLFADQTRFSTLYYERRQAYMQADIRIDTMGKPVTVVAQEVISILGLRSK